MSSHLCLTFFASPFFCSPSPLAILSVDMPPVLSPLLALTGPSVLAHLSSPSFVLCMCGGSCPASPFTHTSLAFCYAWTLGTFLSALWCLDCLLYGYGIVQMRVAIPGTL